MSQDTNISHRVKMAIHPLIHYGDQSPEQVSKAYNIIVKTFTNECDDKELDIFTKLSLHMELIESRMIINREEAFIMGFIHGMESIIDHLSSSRREVVDIPEEFTHFVQDAVNLHVNKNCLHRKLAMQFIKENTHGMPADILESIVDTSTGFLGEIMGAAASAWNNMILPIRREPWNASEQDIKHAETASLPLLLASSGIFFLRESLKHLIDNMDDILEDAPEELRDTIEQVKEAIKDPQYLKGRIIIPYYSIGYVSGLFVPVRDPDGEMKVGKSSFE